MDFTYYTPGDKPTVNREQAYNLGIKALKYVKTFFPDWEDRLNSKYWRDIVAYALETDGNPNVWESAVALYSRSTVKLDKIFYMAAVVYKTTFEE